MKTIYFALSLLFCVFTGTGFGQNCLLEGIRFATQNDIDQFAINYPGCTVIEGDVCIGDCIEFEASDITNLDGLSQLTSIKGKLNIEQNPLLTSLQGLQNLEVIEDDLIISRNQTLASLDGLDQIRLMKGSFTIEWCAGFETITGFEMLDTILGTLTMTYLWNVTSIDPFSNLKYLGGYDINGLSELTHIPDMNELEYLGDFRLQHNGLAAIPQFPLLTEVSGNFHIQGAMDLSRIDGFENIERVNGDLLLDIADHERQGGEGFVLNAFHQLTYVGGRFSMGAQGMDTLDGFTSLDTVVGGFSVDGSNGYHNFPQHNTFSFIGGGIYLTNLPLLTGLECLSGLPKINGLSIGSCTNLLSLSAINHFEKLDGGLEFTYMNFTSLADLANLDTIAGSLRIYDCNSLVDFTGLENLSAIDGHLFIFRNQNLESLEGIQNIAPESIHATGNSAIYIKDNPRLSHCAVESICKALRDLHRTYFIERNDLGCDDVSEIQCEAYGLTGRIFFDENENQIFDTMEVGIPGIPVRIEPGNEIAVSNNQGRFIVYADEGEEFMMTVEQNADWILTTDSLSYKSVYTEGGSENSDHDFGLVNAYDWYGLTAGLTSNPVRCNQNVQYFLHWLNGSTSAIDGRIVFQYDDLVTFVSTTLPPTEHNTTTREMIWVLDSFPLFTEEFVQITFKMPDETFVGQTMEFLTDAFRDSSGTEILMDHVDYAPVLFCAVDPNDKLVMPAGQRDEKYILREDELTYTVRFENLGNVEAIDVTVVDTLDSHFDLQTFKVINSSAPVLISLNENVVTFLFLNIWLPAKGTGFVTYQIQPKEDIQDHTPVENKADIVFDLNQPITTNKTFNTVVYEICENVIFTIDTVICEGGHFMGITEPGIYYDTVSIGSTCDSITIIQINVAGPVIIQIDTAICEGEFFAGFDSTGIFTYDSIDVITGCASVVVLDLEVIPLGTGPCITGIGDLDDQGMKVYPNPVWKEIFVEAPLPIESIRLLTMDGRVATRKDFSESKAGVSMTLPDGIVDGFYILVVKLGDDEYYEKIVVGKR